MECSFLSLDEIEPQVCRIAADVLGLKPEDVRPESRLIEDLYCDSLEFVELIMRLEEHFQVAIPNDVPEPACKALFTRSPFRISDLAELVYLRQGSGDGANRQTRRKRLRANHPPADTLSNGFTQLGGRWRNPGGGDRWLLEPIDHAGEVAQRYRRRSDGMPCVVIPSESVEIGTGGPARPADEGPRHHVDLDAFLIDAEPVSTTAYCRFLNSIDDPSPATLAEWFVLDPQDDRDAHMPIRLSSKGWVPVEGAAYWPMMLVSWFGANAYSLWANAWDWRLYREQRDPEAPCFLPSEAQWEYAARGPRAQCYPWGDETPDPDRARCGVHEPSATYDIHNLPLANVHDPLGLSPFGLHHMAGNVWNWCRDWYDPQFYTRPESQTANPVNRIATGIRSERGGSWVGPGELCRSSYRRGRQPLARGRCLGFRCVSSLSDAPNV